MKYKKTLLSIGTAATTVLPLATVIACANDIKGGDNWYGSHRDIIIYKSTADGQNPNYGRARRMMPSTGYEAASLLGDGSNATQFGLFRKTKIGHDTFSTITKEVNGKKVTSVLSQPNRSTILEFEAAKAVEFYGVDPNTPLATFDSDTNDSADPNYAKKSINGPGFAAAIKRYGPQIRNIKFRLRDDLTDHYWIQQTTGKKGNPITKEDFWTAMEMGMMTNAKTRFNNGGTRTLNAYVNSLINADILTEPNNTTPENFWLLQELSFGIDPDQFIPGNASSKASFLSGDDNAISIKFNGKQTARQMQSFWTQQFEQAGGLKALPTFSVKNAMTKNPITIDAFKAKEDPQKQLDDYKASVLGKIGYLEWLSMPNDYDHYSAGKYYVSKNDKKQITYKQNLDYIDKRFLNKKNSAGEKVTINTMTYNFIQNTDLAPTIIQQAFQQGFGIEGKIGALSHSEYQKALSNPKKYGINYNASYTSSKMLGDYTALQLIPGLSNPDFIDPETKIVKKGEANGLVFYNDNYSKLIWGKKTDELLKYFDRVEDGNTAPDIYNGWADNLYGGTGIQFISNILAASNWFTSLRNFKDGFQESTTQFAPEAPILGDGSTTVKTIAHPTGGTSTLDKLQEQLRSRFAINTKDGSTSAIIATEVSREDYKNVYSSSDENITAIDRYGPPLNQLAIITQNIKEALDRAGISSTEKVVFEFPIGRGITDPIYNQVYSQLIEFLNRLDSRLKIVAKMNPYREHGSNRVPSDDIATEKFSPSFTLDATSGTKPWMKRLYSASIGYSVASLKTAISYKTKSFAGAVIPNTGYLQSGLLLGLSYYAAHPKMIAGTPLSGLKYISDELINQKNILFGNASQPSTVESLFVEDKDPSTGYDVAHKDVFVKALKELDFNTLYQTSVRSIADYDYLGLHGLEKLRSYKRTEEGLDPTSKLKQNLDTISKLFSKWFNNTMYALDDKMHSKASWGASFALRPGITSDGEELQAREMDIIKALNILQPGGINPLSITLGNRDEPSMSIRKNWYSEGGIDNEGYDDISWIRVDLDSTIGGH